MKKSEDKKGKISGWFYAKFFKINDSPQKIALGFGLGIFSGILPATGPLAALFLAFFFRVNKASALLGSLLTNTWLSFLIFIPALKIGAFLFGIQWQELRKSWFFNLTGFNWQGLFKLSLFKAVLPVIAGYFLIAFSLGLLVYFLALIVLSLKKSSCQ